MKIVHVQPLISQNTHLRNTLVRMSLEIGLLLLELVVQPLFRLLDLRLCRRNGFLLKAR